MIRDFISLVPNMRDNKYAPKGHRQSKVFLLYHLSRVGSAWHTSEVTRSLSTQVRLDANRVLTAEPGGPHTTEDPTITHLQNICFNIIEL